MTNAEYQAIRSKYISLLNNKDRTVVEEAMYNYLDKVISYVEIIRTAKSMGNKNPQDNFLVRAAKEKMDQAQENYHKITMAKS